MYGLEKYVRQSGLEPTLLELVNLTLAIIAINGWNRLAISFRSVPGSYRPARAALSRRGFEEQARPEKGPA